MSCLSGCAACRSIISPDILKSKLLGAGANEAYSSGVYHFHMQVYDREPKIDTTHCLEGTVLRTASWYSSTGKLAMFAWLFGRAIR